MGKRILIAEPLDIIRAGLRMILTKDIHVSDIFEVTNDEGLRKQLAEQFVDLIIINQSLAKDMSHLPRGNFVILATEPNVTSMRDAYEHEARAYLSPNVSEAFLHTVLHIPSGSFLVEPALTPLLLKSSKHDIQYLVKEDLLTPREREIVHLLQEGYSRSNIAKQLTIAEATLKTHIKNIGRKREQPFAPRRTTI